MKILYVITTTDCGGAEHALLRLARAARNAGHTVKIISVKPAGTVAQQLRADGFDVLSLDVQNKFSLRQSARGLARLVKEIKAFRPGAVHAFLYRAIQMCRQAKKYADFKLITTPHYNLAKQNYFKRLWDRGLKDADDISCAESQTTADFLTQKQKYDATKVRLICNGVDSAVFFPDAQARANERKRLGFTNRNVVFCCVARLSKEKNHALLLHSFCWLHAKIPQVRLVLVGDGPEKCEIEAVLRKNALEKAVLLAGEVADVRPYLQAADVFVLPSREESLPLSLLEACACGLPAIVSRAGDMPRVVQHGTTGFVFNGTDRALLSMLMAEITENAPLRREMGKIARTRTEKNYPPPEPKYLEIYAEIAQFSRENN